MSSHRRPWYPWYPKDFISDEKVQSLSPYAELLYRRALDVMWQANDQQLPNVCLKLFNAIGKGLDKKSFDEAWSEVQFSGFELFKTTEDGQWIYSTRLKSEAERIEIISKKRSAFGKKGYQAKAKANAKQKLKQTSSHTDTYTDITNTPLTPQIRTPKKPDYPEAFDLWWKLYPKKVGKDAAFKSWKKAVKHNGTKPGDLITAIRNQITVNHFVGSNGENFIPLPTTWLNQGRWKDEIKPSTTVTPKVFERKYGDE